MLALRNRTVKINNGNVDKIHSTNLQHNLNSTTNSDQCLHKEYNYTEHLRILKEDFFNQSIEIERALNTTIHKMAYEFPLERAMLCIPEYNGNANDLDGFLYQVEFFAKQIPAGESEEDLIRTVMFKLKGSAAGFFHRILDESWVKVKTNLIKLFGEKMSLEAIFQQVETLQQGGNEAFSAFKERVLKLKENIINADKNNTEDSYAIRNLKIHFLAGLRNSELQTLARMNKHLDFDELLDYLEDEVVQIEHMRKIETRLNRSEAHNTPQNSYCSGSSAQGVIDERNLQQEECSANSFRRCNNSTNFTNPSNSNSFWQSQHNSTAYNTNTRNINSNFSRPRRYFAPHSSSYHNNYTQLTPSHNSTQPQNYYTQHFTQQTPPQNQHETNNSRGQNQYYHQPLNSNTHTKN